MPTHESEDYHIPDVSVISMMLECADVNDVVFDSS